MPPALYFSHPACLGHDTGDHHPERAERITALEASLHQRDWLAFERRQAAPVAREALVAVHAGEYVDTVRSMSERGGGAFDAETVVGRGSYEAAASAAGAACGMAEALLAREGRVGFCATRPPGHHVRRDSTSGFCLFNNVAVAARHALDTLGSRRIFILDWDVHHGDGTNDIFRATDEVAGYDAHGDDEHGGCDLSAASFAEMARHVRVLGERAGAPVGAVLEGGYALDALVASVSATMEALAGDEPPDSVAPDFQTSRAASYVSHHWEL